MSSMRTALCALLLFVAIAAGAAQAIDCPDLFLSVPAEARDAVIRDCTGASVFQADSSLCSLYTCFWASCFTPMQPAL